MSHCRVGVCSSPVHCNEIGRCFSAPQPEPALTDSDRKDLRRTAKYLGGNDSIETKEANRIAGVLRKLARQL